MATYVEARTIEDAVHAVAGGARPIAGGTDLVVGARQGKKPLPEALVGIHRIAGLCDITADGGSIRLGTLATHAAITAHPAVRARWTALADASAIVGSHATRANGTIGGNVMNASPAMDTGAPLLCFAATALLRGPNGARRVLLEQLWTGPGTTSATDELLVGIDLPPLPDGTGSAYVRLQYRRQMEIAIVGVGTAVTMAGGVITDARLAITALAPTIHRVEPAEARLVGTPGDRPAADAAAALAAEAAAPISDVRGSAGYRRAMAAVMARRAIEAAVTRAGGGTVEIPASDSTYGS